MTGNEDMGAIWLLWGALFILLIGGYVALEILRALFLYLEKIFYKVKHGKP